jgi:glycerol-3-phosphate dehydrogenase
VAPHLVVPEKMLLPLSEKRGLGYWLTSIGLKIYDWLAGVKPEDQRRMLTRLQTLRCEPLLRKDDVKGGAIYAEYRTDDARLTIEIIKEAVAQGAVILSYCVVDDFVYRDEQVNGVKCHDLFSSAKFEVTGATVVNATGPWVDELREVNKSRQGKRLHLTKGVHIVVPAEKFPVQQAIYFDVDDGRMIFAIPRGRTTYIGTTDTNYEDSKDEVVTSHDDAVYLIAAVNQTFPSVNLILPDIESSWAGLRPLIHEDGKSASELSRKDEIFESPTGLISIAGGKLTGYRKMAERVVNLIVRKYFHQRPLKPCHTQKLKLAGSNFFSHREVKDYIDLIFQRIKGDGFSLRTAQYLVGNYGQQSNIILDHYDEMKNEDKSLSLLKAELWFTVRHEMVCTLSDFFIRRTGLLFFDVPRMVSGQQQIASELQQMMQWTDTRISQELATLNRQLTTAQSFK